MGKGPICCVSVCLFKNTPISLHPHDHFHIRRFRTAFCIAQHCSNATQTGVASRWHGRWHGRLNRTDTWLTEERTMTKKKRKKDGSFDFDAWRDAALRQGAGPAASTGLDRHERSEIDDGSRLSGPSIETPIETSKKIIQIRRSTRRRQQGPGAATEAASDAWSFSLTV